MAYAVASMLSLTKKSSNTIHGGVNMNGRDYLTIIPLGGLGKFGMNMTVYEYDGQIIVVDAGVMFPDEKRLRVEFIVPDITYLLENREKVLGVILTHGHEDHIGGLPYLLGRINIPIYGTKLTLALAKNRLREFILPDVQFHEISSENRLRLGNFEIESLRITHSIPDAVALAIHTPIGVVVHSGDFKLDATPVDEKNSELHRLSSLGDEGVLLLLSDSTNAERPGHTPSERELFSALDQIFQSAQEQRIILSTFSSCLYRIQQFIEIAVKHQRLVAVMGRSMLNKIKLASEFGYLNIPEGLLIDQQQLMSIPSKYLAVLTTGSQGEKESPLPRMASKLHPRHQIQKGDIVVLSARIIPERKAMVAEMINNLLHCGAEVIHEGNMFVHVSGHGSQEELKLMLKLVRPKFFMPIHGEERNLISHARLAGQVGIPHENIVLVENGNRVLLNDEKRIIADKISAGQVLVDEKMEIIPR